MNEIKLIVPVRQYYDVGEVLTFWGDAQIELKRGNYILISEYGKSKHFGTAKIITADNVQHLYWAKRVE